MAAPDSELNDYTYKFPEGVIIYVKQSYSVLRKVPFKLFESTLFVYIIPGVVSFTTWPLQIKMEIIDEDGMQDEFNKSGINQDLYTQRIHVCSVPGVVIPPFVLSGPVPGTNYSINQISASSEISLAWNNVTSTLTTVVLPFQKTAYYGLDQRRRER